MALNYERLKAYAPPDIDVNYGERDCIIYALGIGVGLDPLDPGQLRFVYERAEFAAFPTMAVVLGWPGRFTDPAYGVDERLVVAGDVRLTLHRPLKPQARLISRPRVREVIDKGPGNAAIIQNTRNLIEPDGTLVATVDTSTFARKHGGFGGKATQTPPQHAVPQIAPQTICDLPTPPNLALIYRLNGDENPLHADPQRAREAGFDRPILHGAASFGVAAHAVLRTCAGYRPQRLASIEARFSRPVFPGETIRTEMWPEGERVSFQCRVVGRDEIVLSNGLAVLRA
jgi:acyl dehydratase